ncbi:SPX-domain-containing protein [Mollisia scopiformis]|uniref:SPX-domain-containing protein n=1 Tax=Mollisia scopiformis TaxID=149040 RepID=A0A194X759_MOLSC|nr:SPX-domain-containing protein [Mollisia scopiformis]KUJ15647.1 SPX-domain-containing protein [Mollisia scopiformis]
MKYGETFQAQSVPQWAPYNVDYNELKNLIKVHTTKDQAQAIAIPGQADSHLERFEALFFNELSNQHDRVDLFVKSKADEVHRRLQYLQKLVVKLLARCADSAAIGKPMSSKRREKFARYDIQIERCGEDIRSLQRFTAAQRMAFHKILKKYKKWTGSRALGERFNDEILGNPKSFVRRDFEPLSSEYTSLINTLRASSPDGSGPETPSISRRGSRRQSTQIQTQPQTPQGYWNEYDHGSEVEGNESYTIYINPDEESFPGSKTFAYVFAEVKKPFGKVKEWLSPKSSPGERQPLITNGNESYFNEQRSTIDTDDDGAYASSSDFPTGYAAHYATFPSVRDQKHSQAREMLLNQTMFGSFGASLLFLLIAAILVATGKKKLRVEVDAGVIVGIVASLCFNMAAIGAVLGRQQDLGWLRRSLIAVTFVSICIFNGMLLVIVASTL